jgi:exonuclease SbcC
LASCRRATARAEAELEVRIREDGVAAEQLSVAETALTHVERLLAIEGSVEAIERAAAAAAAHGERLENARRTDQAASGDLVEARAEHGAVERTIEPLTAATRRARAALEAATADLDRATRVSDEAWQAFSQAGGDDALAGAELKLSIAGEALAMIKVKLESAEVSLREAEARRSRADQQVAALGAAADSAAAQSRLTAKAVADAVTTIPAEARRNTWDDPEAAAEAASLWVMERRALITDAERRRTEAEAALDRAQLATADLRARRVADLDVALADAANVAVRLAARVDVPSPAATLGPAGLKAWAAAASTEARRRATDRQREAEAADAEAESARAAALAACEKAGIHPARLHEWRAATLREVGAATESRCRATEMALRAGALDAALATSADRARLLSLARDLCQGRESFANHVLVARRQGLIAEAAAILAELSNGRLTFAEDIAATFSVLDTGTGAVRDPRLLSGGEQFQASLALALGLVEIAARAGSRIECLFLDEGFGALDGASLDIALDALEAAARRGRRIVAVTHVDAVTARADHVLGVWSSDSGSRAAWRTPELSAVV